MDSGKNSTSILSSQITKGLHNGGGGEGVETSGGLIEENQTGVSDKLNTNGGSLTFSTGDTLNKRSTNSSLLTFGELELTDDLFNTGHLLVLITGELKLSSEFETLTDGHSLEKNIILLNVGRVCGEVFNVIS